jgi:hypothetical protein
MVLVTVLVAAALAQAHAQPGPPTDAYAKLLAGKSLEEGKGFPGLAEVGTPSRVFQTLGRPRETGDAPFWYFYDKGPWTLIVVTEFVQETGSYVTRAIVIAGTKAPPTKQGVRVGDDVAKVTKVYGKPETFSGSVGSPAIANMVSIDLKTGATRPAVDTEKAFKDSVFYSRIGMLFVIGNGKVERIVTVVADDPLPSFLRDPKDAKLPDPSVATIDASVDVPDYSGTTLRVPAPPALVPSAEKGFGLDVPKGWTKAGTKWTDKSGREFVEVTESTSTDKPEVYFAAQEAKFGANRVIPKQRELPPELAAMIGADAAYALWKQEGKLGKKDMPLRSFVLMAAKGDRRFTIVVARTASGAQPSPDGETLARGVLRSFRIK